MHSKSVKGIPLLLNLFLKQYLMFNWLSAKAHRIGQNGSCLNCEIKVWHHYLNFLKIQINVEGLLLITELNF